MKPAKIHARNSNDSFAPSSSGKGSVFTRKQPKPKKVTARRVKPVMAVSFSRLVWKGDRNREGNYWQLPRTTEAYDQLIEQGAKASFDGMQKSTMSSCRWNDTAIFVRKAYLEDTRIIFASAGIVRPGEGRK